MSGRYSTRSPSARAILVRMATLRGVRVFLVGWTVLEVSLAEK